MDEIRYYIGRIAEAAGVQTDEWAARAGIERETLDRFLAGADLELTTFLKLCEAVDAFVLPIPRGKHDETLMLLEAEGLYPDGVSDPFDKYRGL